MTVMTLETTRCRPDSAAVGPYIDDANVSLYLILTVSVNVVL
jgi:hypothetical protein